MSSTVLWLITFLFFTVGLVGIVVPTLPGIAFVFGGIAVYAFFTDFTQITVSTLIVFGVITFLTAALDYAAAALGVRVGGGKQLAVLGTVIGVFAGLVIAGPLGLIVGAAIGAFVGALIESRDIHQAKKAVLVSLISIVGATLVQVAVGVSMIAAFLIIVLK